jgi:hypothetical protein
MQTLFFDWLSGIEHDIQLRGVNREAIRLFSLKIKNLISKGHNIDRPQFYWTNGSQKRPDRGPYLRAAMVIDGKMNRFWLYHWGTIYKWQNTTKQRKSYKKTEVEVKQTSIV